MHKWPSSFFCARGLRPVLASAALTVVLSANVALSQPAPASPVPEETGSIAAEVMRSIAAEIEHAKRRYPELSGFSGDNVSPNGFGLPEIEYEFVDAASRRHSKYAFGLTVVPLDDKTFEGVDGYFSYEYPFLNVKFAGYLQKHPLRNQYNIVSLLKKFDGPLERHQQKFLPVQLTLTTVKNAYRVNEDILFDVELKNVSRRNLNVRSLGEKTLFFLYNNDVWGTRPSSEERGGDPVMLKPGDSLKLRLKGEGFPGEKEIEIYGVYRLSINGVNPSGILNVRVVRE